MYIISRVRHCEGGKEKVTVEGNSGNGPLALTGHRGKREGGPGGREEGGREGRSDLLAGPVLWIHCRAVG